MLGPLFNGFLNYRIERSTSCGVSPVKRGMAAAKAAGTAALNDDAEPEALGMKLNSLIALLEIMPTSIGLSAIPRVAQLYFSKDAFSRKSLLLFHPLPSIGYI